LALMGGAAAAAPAATPQTPRLGRPATAAELQAVDISIGPDGGALPAGSGSAVQGAAVFAAKCQACHGAAGAGGPNDRLTGGVGSLATPKPVKTLNSFWPYATTAFDYIRRAMPLTAPQSLTNDEVYALVAYLLSVDGIVARDAALDARTLPLVKMPNRDGFESWEAKYRPRTAAR
ncbi:MAG: cytochrome c class, partial [Caulobacteraceae bacterium]|nr:cytochrome c class [Caulobacteraceae bacterium]